MPFLEDKPCILLGYLKCTLSGVTTFKYCHALAWMNVAMCLWIASVWLITAGNMSVFVTPTEWCFFSQCLYLEKQMRWAEGSTFDNETVHSWSDPAWAILDTMLRALKKKEGEESQSKTQHWRLKKKKITDNVCTQKLWISGSCYLLYLLLCEKQRTSYWYFICSGPVGSRWKIH